VGRTTIAAAMALAASRLGKRVLLAEIEEPSRQSHSTLARKFGRDLFTTTPRPIMPGLEGVMLSTDRGTELFLTGVFKIAALARLALRTPALLRMLHAAPSFHEMGIFNHLLTLLEARRPDGRPRYDIVLVDMPATGHTLALTGLPRILLKLVSRGPIAEALRQGQAILHDPQRAAACVVTLPEPLPVSESLELIEGLKETDMPVGAILVNRVPRDPFDADERRAVTEMLAGAQVFGAYEVDRIERATSALDRLRRESDLPLLIIDEQNGEDGETIEAIAHLLHEAAA